MNRNIFNIDLDHDPNLMLLRSEHRVRVEIKVDIENSRKTTSCYCSLPGGKAMPYPFESSSPPICVVSHSRSMTYSIVVDSMRNAYFPLPFLTLSMPSVLPDVKTVGFVDSMKDHIRW